MNIEVIADMEGESTPAGDTSLVYTHLLFDVRNSAITSLTYGSSASISKTTDRVIVTVDPDSANPRVLNYSPTITSGGSGTFSISGVATTWALSPGDHTVSATVEYLSSAGGLVNVAAPPATFTVTETPNPAMSFVGTPTTSITSNGDGSSRIHVYYTVDLSGFNITQLTPGAMGEQQNIGSIATSIDGAPANWTETTAHTPGTTYGNTDFEFYVDVPDPAPATYQTSMLLDYKYNYSFHGEIIERAGSSSIDNTF